MPLNPAQQQTLLWTAVAALIGWALVVLGPILSPFIAAAMLAYALEPGVRWLTHRRLPRILAVIAVIALTLLALFAIVLILVPIVQQESALIRNQFPALAARITEQVLPWINQTLGLEIRIDVASIRNWLTQHLATSGEDLAAALLSYAKSGWSAALQVIGFVFLVPVALFYLLLDWNTLLNRLSELIPPRWRERIGGLLGETDHLLGQYMRGQLLVMISLAAFYAICLLLAGFKLWLPIGVLTGLLIAIPYLGFALGLLFALAAGMLEFGPLPGLARVAVIYGVGQVLESLVLTPRLVGERIGLHPLAVIFALIAFGFLLGFVGVLLALPLSAILVVALRRLRNAYLDSPFYHGR